MAEEPHADPALVVDAIGGFNKIGASSCVVSIDGVSVMFDCGIHVDPTERAYPRSLENARPDVVLISHAHVDHVGALPIVVKNNPGVPVFATPPTRSLAHIMLKDVNKLSRIDGRPIFTSEELENAINAITPKRFREKFRFGPLEIEFRAAGHILGAATIIVRGSSTVVFTGDFASAATRLTPPPDIPTESENCALLICETTYGGREMAPRTSQEEELASSISSILEQRGRVLIPSFALGRAQEVVVILVSAMREGRIPLAPIYIDGLVKDVTSEYISLSDWFRDPAQVDRLNDWELTKPVQSIPQRLDMLVSDEPCIIVASSGMLTGGWSTFYAKDILSRRNSGIFFVGYLDEESPGRKLAEFDSGLVTLFEEEIAPKCQLKKFVLSAHADRDGIETLIRAYRPTFLFPVHGEPRSRWQIAKWAKMNGIIPLVPYNDQRLTLSPATRDYAFLPGEHDALAIQFLEEYPVKNVAEDQIMETLVLFARNNRITEYKQIEEFLWSVFRMSGNYVDTDAWVTVSQRSPVFRACNRVLSEMFPQISRTLAQQFEKTARNFLANIVLYGGNVAWKEIVKEVNVSSIEEAESLLVQVKSLVATPPLLRELYEGCERRSEWPADTDAQAKFYSIFRGVQFILPLLKNLDRLADFLIIENCLVGAVDGTVILILALPEQLMGGSGKDVGDRVEDVLVNRLFQLTGWKLDKARVALSKLAGSEQQKGLDEIVLAELDDWLSKAIEPFRKDVPNVAILQLSKVQETMWNHGFEVSVTADFLMAKHKSSRRRLLVAIDKTGTNFSYYKNKPGFVMDEARFRTTISRLDKIWRPKPPRDQDESNQLAIDVIVPYGWRSGNNPTERREALEKALDVLDFNHLVHLLKYLENMWGNQRNQRMRGHAVAAKADREWLEATYGFERTLAVSQFAQDVASYCGLQFTKVRFDRYFVIETAQTESGPDESA